MGTLNEELLAAARYLEAAGMSQEQLWQLHHFWPRRKVTYWQTYDHFSKHEISCDNNVRYAERLKFVATQHKQGNKDFDDLVREALKKWPL